jgi:site-specific DNA methylase
LTSGSGGFGGHSGLYLIENTENFGLPIKSKTKDGYQIAYHGDSIDTVFSGQNSRRGRVGNQIAHTLTTSATQAVFYLLPERENDRISHRPLAQSVKLVGRNESKPPVQRVVRSRAISPCYRPAPQDAGFHFVQAYCLCLFRHPLKGVCITRHP